MQLKVDDAILQKTTECDVNLACLNSKQPSVCKINKAFGDKVLFVYDRKRPCNYYRSFGYSGYCSCPVRQELYRKYGI